MRSEYRISGLSLPDWLRWSNCCAMFLVLDFFPAVGVSVMRGYRKYPYTEMMFIYDSVAMMLLRKRKWRARTLTISEKSCHHCFIEQDSFRSNVIAYLPSISNKLWNGRECIRDCNKPVCEKCLSVKEGVFVRYTSMNHQKTTYKRLYIKERPFFSEFYSFQSLFCVCHVVCIRWINWVPLEIIINLT